MENPKHKTPTLEWSNVLIGFCFILLNVILSLLLGLDRDIPKSLLTAAVRCVIQLSVLTLVLGGVFKGGPWAVAALAIVFNILGTFETVVNKSKRRFSHMFPSVLLAMGSSTLPVSIIGSQFAMSNRPFWVAESYIPILGMLCGSTISGIVVAVSSVLREIEENRDKVETYLAYGASRFEACKPIATEALRLALLPTINQMSVIGLISIPGMMTGALLGGSSIEQAAKLQMIIMFMISSSTALASTVATVMALSVSIDPEHRLRTDRVDNRPHAIWRTRDRWVANMVGAAKWLAHKGLRRDKGENGDQGERERLLPG
ncbi:hypothetical protein FRC03_009322 [Tulasnella sp. 419]|nr:hypothetical protein FRC03_009322 [Tulasnella sp. 419]